MRSIEGQTHFSTFLACQIEFDPEWTDIECFTSKPPHCLQTCPAIIGRVVCKSTNSRPKVMLSSRITLARNILTTIELSFNSMGLLVESWLFCVQYLSCSMCFWCMLGGSFLIWMTSNLFWFIEGQTHLGVQRGARMSLALNEPKWVALLWNSYITSKDAPLVKRNHWNCRQTTNGNS